MTDNNTFLGNIEAEEAILGGILLDPTAISIVVDMLPVEAFYVQSHQLLYKTALELYQKDKPTDLMHVSTWLADHNLLEKVGGTTKLSQLLNRTVSAANIDRYALLVLNKYARKNHQSTRTLKLLRDDQMRQFEVTLQQNDTHLKCSVDPFRLHDTYALDLTLRFSEEDIAIEPSDLVPLNSLQSKLNPSLGKTLILFAEPPENLDDYGALADKCAAALLQQPVVSQNANLTNSTAQMSLIHVEGTLFGSPIFEYEVSPAEEKPESQHCHILVWFNCHPETKKLEQAAYWDLLQLLCCRTKILHSHHQARLSNQKARQIYRQLEQKSQSLNDLQVDPIKRLEQLKSLLTEMPLNEFKYARYLLYLEDLQTTIRTNAEENYPIWLEGIKKRSQEREKSDHSQNSPDNLEFLQNFLERTRTYQRQIEVDLSYLTPAKALFKQMLDTIRGIVEIEQAEASQKKEEAEKERERQYLQQLRAKDEADKKRDNRLQTTVYIVTAGLGGGAIVASTTGLLTSGSKNGEVTVQWLPRSIPASLHPFSVGVGLSIISGLAFGVAAWGVRQLMQIHREKTGKRKIEAFIQLLTNQTQSNLISAQDIEELSKLFATLPNEVQALSDGIGAWCQAEGRSPIRVALLKGQKTPPKNNSSQEDKDYKKELLALIAPQIPPD